MKVMIILSLLFLFGAVTGILNDWVVVIIGFGSMLVLPYYAAWNYRPDPKPKHAPITHCTNCGSEVSRHEYAVQCAPHPIMKVVEWHCTNRDCQAMGIYNKSDELQTSEDTPTEVK